MLGVGVGVFVGLGAWGLTALFCGGLGVGVSRFFFGGFFLGGIV